MAGGDFSKAGICPAVVILSDSFCGLLLTLDALLECPHPLKVLGALGVLIFFARKATYLAEQHHEEIPWLLLLSACLPL